MPTFSGSPTPLLAFIIAAAFVVSLSRCASPESVQQPAPEPAPAKPAGTALYLDDAGLTLHRFPEGHTRVVLANATSMEREAVSPDGRKVVVTHADEDSVRLSVVDAATGTVYPLHASADGDVAYSAAWFVEGDSVAFGYYVGARGTGRNRTLGPGGIAVAASDGSGRRSLGCSAAKRVERGLPDGSLVVGDATHRYVVSSSDCATVATIPALRKRSVTFSPDGQWVAFFFRELVYDRDERSYEPESTLYVADSQGEEERMVVGVDYDPRHPVWAPDGGELAFDVRSEKGGERHISLYDPTSNRASYLIPPENGLPSRDTRPRWSPDGERMAFQRELLETGARHLVVYHFLEMRSETVDADLPSGDARWEWIDDDALVMDVGADSVTVVLFDRQATVSVPGGSRLLHVVRD